jgi:threonine/homoserine/homoserine lactone efflux protein
MLVLPEAETVAVFMAASLALYISPGPDMMFILSKAMGGGFRAGFWASVGVNLGITIHMLAAAIGLAALVASAPLLLDAITWAGVVYLACIGVRMILNKGAAGTPKPTDGTDIGRTVREGLLINLLNPKISLFFLAFLPQFADPDLGPISGQLLFFGGLFNLAGFAFVLTLCLIAGSAASLVARRPIVARVQEIVSGSVLIAMAVGVALSSRR